MRINITFLPVACLMLALVLLPRPAAAHQPYCEFEDVTAAAPWEVPDATISYAYYGNLFPAGDVDFFTFEAAAGQSVLISLSIPAIAGQEDFAPLLAIYGPGVDDEAGMALPDAVKVPADQGAALVDVGEEPEYWFEPFGGRYYWNWENSFFEAPEAGTFTVALWHPDQELGRYSFVVGEEEVFGGDRECSASFDEYWTPLRAGDNPYRSGAEGEAGHSHSDAGEHEHSGNGESTAQADDSAAHAHGDLLEVTADNVPVVDLQVIPLDDGSFNVRVQTLNFIFSPQRVDMAPVEGEGHAHLYIDGVKIARLYGEWYHLDALPEDAETISVTLYANNHQPLAVDGKPIEASVAVARSGG